jgi:hypothetical protein
MGAYIYPTIAYTSPPVIQKMTLQAYPIRTNHYSQNTIGKSKNDSSLFSLIKFLHLPNEHINTILC